MGVGFSEMPGQSPVAGEASPGRAHGRLHTFGFAGCRPVSVSVAYMTSRPSSAEAVQCSPQTVARANSLMQPRTLLRI